MRTQRMILSGAVALALAMAPAAVAAQASDPEAPAPPSHWTGSTTSGPGFSVPNGEVGFFDWGYRTTMGLTFALESDDPRAAGDLQMVYVLDWSDKHDIGRGTGLARLTNEGGSFIGPVNVIYYPDGSEFRMALMEGQGGSDGLTYSMSNFLDGEGGEQSQGLIWEGEPPALPDAELLPG